MGEDSQEPRFGTIRNKQKKPEGDSLRPLFLTFVALGTADGIIQRVGILSLGTRTILVPKGRDQSSDPQGVDPYPQGQEHLEEEPERGSTVRGGALEAAAN